MTLSRSRILLLAPHPDDESLSSAGLLLRASRSGAALKILFLTDGEKNPWPQRYIEKRLVIRHRDRMRWAELRRREALSALEVLGIPPSSLVFLHLPDDGLESLTPWERERAIVSIREELRQFRPDLVIRPCANDLHPDHRAAARIWRSAADGEERPFLDISYLIHGRPNGNRVAFRLPLARDEFARKLKAIGCYRSQLALSRKRFFDRAAGVEIFFDDVDHRPPRMAGLRRVVDVLSALRGWS